MKLFNSFCTASLIFLIGTPVFAVNINLYEQPKKDAKIVGTIDSEVGIIPIFTPKEGGDWVKVADPRNGNVGWMTSSDLKTSNTKGSNFSFRVMTTGSGPNSYQIVQFGSPQQLTTQDAQAFLKRMQLREQELQKDMQNMMNDLFGRGQMNWPNSPVIVPVVMVPQPGQQNAKQPAVSNPSQPAAGVTAKPATPPTVVTPPTKNETPKVDSSKKE